MMYDLPNAYDDHLETLEQNATDHVFKVYDFMTIMYPTLLADIERRMELRGYALLFDIASTVVIESECPF